MNTQAQAAGVELLGDRVRLRTYRPHDVAALYEAIAESMAELRRWMPWCHDQYSRDDTRSWIESRPDAWAASDEYSLLIADCQTDRCLGGCGLNHINLADRCANLGYWIRTSYVGRGLATDATRLLARWGLGQLGFERIEIIAAIGNRASQRVAEKAGATRESVARRRIRLGQKQHDAVCYSLVRSDFADLDVL